MVGAMLLWHSSNLPERFFDPLGQGLKGLAETDGSCFHIGVGQDKMIDEVRKGFSRNGHPQIFHMSKIGLCSFSWCMHLFKDDVFFWPMQHSPFGNMSP